MRMSHGFKHERVLVRDALFRAFVADYWDTRPVQSSCYMSLEWRFMSHDENANTLPQYW